MPELTIINESEAIQTVTLGGALLEGVHIIWNDPETAQRLQQEQFTGYLRHISVPDLLPLHFTDAAGKEAVFLKQFVRDSPAPAHNVWHAEPIRIGGGDYIRFNVPAKQKLFLAFRIDPEWEL